MSRFARPEKGMLQPLQLKKGIMQLVRVCATPKAVLWSRFTIYVSTTRPKIGIPRPSPLKLSMLWLSSTKREHLYQIRPKKNISTKFNRGKYLDCVKPRKNISTEWQQNVCFFFPKKIVASRSSKVHGLTTIHPKCKSNFFKQFFYEKMLGIQVF